MNRPVSGLKVLAFTFALLSLLTLVTGVAFGQAVSGNLVGTVLDSSGAAVANVDVQATNIATGVSATTKTGGTGEYRFGNLEAGNYKLTVKASGFRTVTEQVPVDLNKTGTVNFTLAPGSASETVEVSGAPPIIDTTTSQLETTYELKQLQDLPSAANGVEGVLNLSLLQSGVASSGGLGAGTGPSVGGQRPRDNNFTIEGVDNNDKTVTGPLVYVPNDAVANFTLLQNQFSPEFGHSNGGQFNTVVQSGTNSFHGVAYEYFQNRNLDAIDQGVVNQNPGQSSYTNPRFDDNRFGGEVGGPIIKNKLFFFANYEYWPIGQAAILASPAFAPTANGYSQLDAVLAGSGASTANVDALKLWAVAPANDQGTIPVCTTNSPLIGCPATANIDIGTVPIIAPNYNNTEALTTAIDYNISDRDQLRGRYIYNKNSFVDFSANLPAFYTTLIIPYHLINISEFHTFSPSLSNEFRVGYHRTGNNYTVPDKGTFLSNLDSFPNITLDDLNGIDVGPDPNAPQYAEQNLYQAVDNVTLIKGAHTLKFGIEGRKYIAPQKFIQRARGDYEWAATSDFAYDYVPDFAERSFGSLGYDGNQKAIYWYVNDIWKIRSNLSLNLGVRYEWTQIPHGWTLQSLNDISSVPGLISFAAPVAPKKDFMPRLGFAYSPGSSGNTSIRGGFGMGYDVLYDNIGSLSNPPQIGSTTDCPNPSDPNCFPTNFLAQGGILPQSSSGITTYDQATARSLTSAYLPPNVQYPYALSWNLGVQHVFKSNYTADVRYVGTHSVHLNVQNRVNVQDIVTPSQYLPTYFSTSDYSQASLDALPFSLTQLSAESNILPAFAAAGLTNPIVGFVPWGDSNYNGLQTQLNRRFANGLQFQAAWTWSHTIDNATADFFSTVISPRRPQDFRDLAAERGNSLLDHDHRLTIQAIYEVPWYAHSSSWLARNLLGNYEIAPVYTYETGQWGTVQSGIDANLNGDNAGDRPVINPAGDKHLGTGVTALTAATGPNAGQIVAYVANNPNAYYVVAAKGALSDGSRGSFETPPINNWDITVAKHFALTERYRLDFQLQMFNALNHPQPVTGSPNTIFPTSDTGQRNYLIPNQSSFQDAKGTFLSNARFLQLALKFSF